MAQVHGCASAWSHSACYFSGHCGGKTHRPPLRRFPVDLTILLDCDNVATRDWKVGILPVSFLIAPDGSIRYSVIGEFEWTDDKAVTDLLRSQ